LHNNTRKSYTLSLRLFHARFDWFDRRVGRPDLTVATGFPMFRPDLLADAASIPSDLGG